MALSIKLLFLGPRVVLARAVVRTLIGEKEKARQSESN
jgi:hypothetical protein